MPPERVSVVVQGGLSKDSGSSIPARRESVTHAKDEEGFCAPNPEMGAHQEANAGVKRRNETHP
jgi:hypothetical protein